MNTNNSINSYRFKIGNQPGDYIIGEDQMITDSILKRVPISMVMVDNTPSVSNYVQNQQLGTLKFNDSVLIASTVEITVFFNSPIIF